VERVLFGNFKVVKSRKVYKEYVYSNINMPEEYQPTRKEVFGEMVNGVRQYFSGDNLKNIGSKLKQTGGNFLTAVGLVSVCPYILPTTIRGVKDAKTSSSGETEFDATHHVGYSTGLLGGLALDVVQITGYSYAVENDHPEALLIPVVTNVASGVYEVGRSMYKNARERVLEKHKTEGLEATLQE
jgi:hypothetical protein